MTNLEKHAKREMELAGLYDKDADYGGMIPQAVMAMISAHSAQGHSGGSHEITLQIFDKLVRFKTLTPITSNPDDWFDRAEENGGVPLWQSNRDPAIFSVDGGKTWYNIDKPHSATNPIPMR